MPDAARAPTRLRIATLTVLALLAFAGNSLLCRAALANTDIDPASFTAIRILSGAMMLVLLLAVRPGPLPAAGSWRSAAALFAYAIAFSYAYTGLSAGTGALLLFGAVQATMLVAGLFTGTRWSAWQAAGLALALAVGLSVVWLVPATEPELPGARRAVVVTPLPAADVGDSISPPMPIDFHRFALNALLAPLIDDAGRWTDVALEFMCDPGTRVLVDGQALKSGEPVPAQAFVLRWDMGHCQPYGHAIALTGAVRLVVSRGDAGLMARVMPERLWIHGPAGRVAIDRPFMTTLSLAPSAHEP